MIVVFDDATSEVYYARLVEEESTATVMAGVKQVVEERGVFCALYSDRASHFVYTPKAGGPPDRAGEDPGRTGPEPDGDRVDRGA